MLASLSDFTRLGQQPLLCLAIVLLTATGSKSGLARPQIIITVTEHGPDTISGPVDFVGPLPGPGLPIPLSRVIDAGLFQPFGGTLVLCEGGVTGGAPNSAGQVIGTGCSTSDSDILVFKQFGSPKLSYQSDSEIGSSDQQNEISPPADVTTFTLERPDPIRFIAESLNSGGIELTPYDPDLRQPGSEKFENLNIPGTFLPVGYNVISDDPTFVPEPPAIVVLLTGLLASLCSAAWSKKAGSRRLPYQSY